MFRFAHSLLLTSGGPLCSYHLTHARYSSERWRSFLDVGVLQHLQAHLQLGHLQQASCIWSRHQVRGLAVFFVLFLFFTLYSFFSFFFLQGALVLELDSSNILSLFHSIPDSVPSSELFPWLCTDSIPFLLQHTPQALVCIGVHADGVEMQE